MSRTHVVSCAMCTAFIRVCSCNSFIGPVPCRRRLLQLAHIHLRRYCFPAVARATSCRSRFRARRNSLRPLPLRTAPRRNALRFVPRPPVLRFTMGKSKLRTKPRSETTKLHSKRNHLTTSFAPSSLTPTPSPSPQERFTDPSLVPVRYAAKPPRSPSKKSPKSRAVAPPCDSSTTVDTSTLL